MSPHSEQIGEGNDIPSCQLWILNEEGKPVTVDIKELFGNKKVVLFAVPGPFTPGCSKTHLPGFQEHEKAIKAKGIDLIACLSVADPFVMKAWAEKHNVKEDEIMMLADGNNEFTKAVGLSLDAQQNGMGMRSKRYAMVVNHGKVESLYIDEPKQIEFTTGEYILARL